MSDVMLKPCPFCGGTLMRMRKREITRWGQKETKFMMQCVTCQAQTGLKEAEVDAIACWNLRHDETYEGADRE